MIRICFLAFLMLFPSVVLGQAPNQDRKLVDRADILIVTSDVLKDAWKPFARWKTMTGRPTKVVSIGVIEESFEGKDIQEKIRRCCLSNIEEQGTRFVIIGGDSEGKSGGHVPDRDTDHSKCSMLPYSDIPTDLYFISELDWDSNDDGIYGTFSEDMDDVQYTNPNACIGRIPVRTAEDVLAYTEKVIAYESRYPVGDFAKRMVYTCPEKAAFPKLGTSIKEVSGSWESGDIVKFFSTESPWDDQRKGDYHLTPENWVKMINERDAAKIHMHGHGILPLWVLEGNSKVTKSTVGMLRNENAYPIVTTVSCLTGQYDDKQDPSIAETMIRQPAAGAIAVLAPSREGVPFMMKQTDFRLMMTEGKMDGTTDSYTRFWKSALGEQMTLGEAFRQVKKEMESNARRNIGFHMLQCELNLLGDPTLDPRAIPPTHFNGRVRVSKGKIIARGFAGATICIWDGDQHYQVIQADDDSTTQIELAQDGTYSFAAFGPGFNTWVKEGIEFSANK